MEENNEVKQVKLVHTQDGKELLFIKTDKAIMEQLTGKPAQDQLKVLLKLLKDFKAAGNINEDIRIKAGVAEKKISRELQQFYADLN